MAVRFDNTNEFYTRNQALGVVTTWSVTCWVKMAVDRGNTATVVWQIDASAGSNRLRINAWNGHDLTFQTDSGGWFANVGHTLVVGEWTFIGFSGTSNPGEARVAVRTAGNTTYVGGTSAQANVTFNANILRIGCGSSTSEFINGSMAAVKVWDVAMSETELQQESWTYLPQRTANLRAFYPFLKPDLNDASGNGQTLSGGSNTALDDGPPISWSTGRHRVVLPAAASPVSGTLAATLPELAADVAGVAEVAGSLAGTLPAATGTFAGESDLPSGQLAGALPVLTGSIAGDLDVTGALGGTLPALTAELTDLKTGDFDFHAGPPRRGWSSRDLARDWTDSDTVRRWAARTLTL